MHSVKFILWSTASFRRHLLQKAISLPHAITLRTGSNKKAPAFHRGVVPGEKAGASFILCVDLSGLPVTVRQRWKQQSRWKQPRKKPRKKRPRWMRQRRRLRRGSAK